jgi:small subunit ribosomal protein S17
MARTSTSAPPAETTTQGAATGPKPARLTKVGRVVSDKMQKTVVVTVDYPRRHRLYSKVMTRTSRFKAHDENNECKVGDIVRIEESRPISKDKRWVVREILQRAGEA